MARPGPSSCQSCRTKKLKCNRVQPCSNCSARAITCVFVTPPLPELKSNPTGRYSSLNYDAGDIMNRLERLESLVLPKEPPWQQATPETTPNEKDGELESLQHIGTRDDGLLAPLSNGEEYVIQDTREILSNQSESYRAIAAFPPFQVANLLFDNFETTIDHICPVLHNPTARAMIQTTYLRIHQKNEVVPPGQAALLLSIFSLSAFFYQVTAESKVATSSLEATHLSKIWAIAALDMLNNSQRTTSGTLEDVQAYIVMSFVTYHLDGFSSRNRHVTAMAASIAKDLRLHRLDANPPNPLDLHAVINDRVKRRVFWHIVSTDWLNSATAGPQEGTYYIHPQHIHTRKPQSCEGNEIVLSENSHNLSTNLIPVRMTFFLARIQLAELCRHMTDTVPLSATSKAMTVPYEHVVTLDRQFTELLSKLPFFLCLDHDSREQSRMLEVIYPRVPFMRNCLAMAIYSKRCRLHHIFLLRQSADLRFAYSREACLESARIVIQLFDESSGVSADTRSQQMEKARMGIVVQSTYLALLVLVMDLCVNRNTAAADEARKLEVESVMARLERLRHISPLLGRCLDALEDILLKYGIILHAPNLCSAPESNSWGKMTGQDHMPFEDIEQGSVELDSSFDTFWETMVMQNEADPDVVDWESMFFTLDSRPF